MPEQIDEHTKHQTELDAAIAARKTKEKTSSRLKIPIAIAFGFLLFLVITAFGLIQTKPASITQDESENPSKMTLVQMTFVGGLCPKGKICSTIQKILADGSLVVNNEEVGSLSKDQQIRLKRVINETDFEKMRSQKFTGICPTAYDGQEVFYTFQTEKTNESVSSCKVSIDQNHPLFVELNDIQPLFNKSEQ